LYIYSVNLYAIDLNNFWQTKLTFFRSVRVSGYVWLRFVFSHEKKRNQQLEQLEEQQKYCPRLARIYVSFFVFPASSPSPSPSPSPHPTPPCFSGFPPFFAQLISLSSCAYAMLFGTFRNARNVLVVGHVWLCACVSVCV